MHMKKYKWGMLFGITLMSVSAGLLAGCTDSTKERAPEMHHRVEDKKLIKQDVEEDGSHQLTAVEQHRYFMKNIDSIVDYAQESREQGKKSEEIQKQLDKVEQEIAFLDKLKLPKEMKSEYQKWKNEKQTQIDVLKKKLPDENHVNLDNHKHS